MRAISRDKVQVRPIREGDAADWERMRETHWPSEPGEHAREITSFFSGNRRDPAEVLIALDETGRVLGFAEVSIRPYAEGCYSGRVAYLEGWFVEAACRRKGVGTALVRAVEDWGRVQGCTELGSDAEIDNLDSAAAQGSLGFTEVQRIVCFRKSL